MKSIYKISSFLILTFMSIPSVIFSGGNNNILKNQNNHMSLIEYDEEELIKLSEDRYDLIILNNNNDHLNCEHEKNIFNELEKFKNKILELHQKKTSKIFKQLKQIPKIDSNSNKQAMNNSAVKTISKCIKKINNIKIFIEKFIDEYNLIYSKIIKILKENNLLLRNLNKTIKKTIKEQEKEEITLWNKVNKIQEEIKYLEYELNQIKNPMGQEQKIQQKKKIAEKKEECQLFQEKIKKIQSNKQNALINSIKKIIVEEIDFVNKKLLELNNLQ